MTREKNVNELIAQRLKQMEEQERLDEYENAKRTIKEYEERREEGNEKEITQLAIESVTRDKELTKREAEIRGIMDEPGL